MTRPYAANAKMRLCWPPMTPARLERSSVDWRRPEDPCAVRYAKAVAVNVRFRSL
jgi:hypothetical protein